jgi:hypothetical protein
VGRVRSTPSFNCAKGRWLGRWRGSACSSENMPTSDAKPSSVVTAEGVAKVSARSSTYSQNQLYQPRLDFLRIESFRGGSHYLYAITPHPRIGFHYGQDRLIPNWMVTLSLKQKRRGLLTSRARRNCSTTSTSPRRGPIPQGQGRASANRRRDFLWDRTRHHEAYRRGLDPLLCHGLYAPLVRSAESESSGHETSVSLLPRAGPAR